MRARFPLIDIYAGIRLGTDLSTLRPDDLRIVESDRRLRREGSYGFIHALWWLRLTDGASVLSVPPGAGGEIRKLLTDPAVLAAATGTFDSWNGESTAAASLAAFRCVMDRVLARFGLPPVDSVVSNLEYAHNGTGPTLRHAGHCRRLRDGSIPGAEGVLLPEHCFPNGIVYGVVEDGAVVSVAYAHRTGVMEGKIADIGVVTSPAYRRRGYAKAAVSAVTAEITRTGGEARYSCRPDNSASRLTAVSLGFAEYGEALVMSVKRNGRSE